MSEHGAGVAGEVTTGSSGSAGMDDTAGATNQGGAPGIAGAAGEGSAATAGIAGTMTESAGGTMAESAGGTSMDGGSSSSGASGGWLGSGGAASAGVGGSGGSIGAGGSSGAGGASAGSGSAGGYAGASSLGDCRADTYGGHTYLFCNVKLAWTVARDNCASIGMQLARVDDAGENDFLGTQAYASLPLRGMWLSATDAAVEGEWRWPNGELFWLGDKSGAARNGLYNAWYIGTQPGAVQAGRDCALLDLGGSHGWYDSDCTFQLEYVCESP